MDIEQAEEQQAMQLLKLIERVFVEEKATVQQALRALLILCAVNANNLHLSKETFLAICSSVYDNDNKVRNMELN